MERKFLHPETITAELVREFLARVERNKRGKARRSKGIVDIKVTHRPVQLYLWGAYASNRKVEIPECYELEGQIDLIWQSGRVHNQTITMPDGARIEFRVHYMGGTVMIMTPGSSWSIHGQIGKRRGDEAAVIRRATVESPAGTSAESPATYQWNLSRPGEPEA